MDSQKFFDQYQDKLKAYCCYITGKPMANPDVQDLLSNSWHKILKAQDQSSGFKGRNGASWLTWAKTIIRNTWFRYLDDPRRLTYADPNIEYLMDRLDITSSSVVYNDETAILVFQMLEQELTKKHLAVTYLKSVGFKGKEIADILSININTVYSRLYYAKKYVEKLFTEPL